MRLSKTLVHSLREYPADLDMDSQKLLLKGGLITKVDSGLYAFTPLGYSFLENIQKIIEDNSKKKWRLSNIHTVYKEFPRCK
nr:hypothetical protein [Clostridium botulinum]